jgi:hypothetical protein
MIFTLFPLLNLLFFAQTTISLVVAPATAIQLVPHSDESLSSLLSQYIEIGERCHRQKDYTCAILHYQV